MTENGENILEEYGKTASGGIDVQSYFDVKSCMQRYINNLNIKNNKYYIYDKTNNKLIVSDENEIKQNIYDLLSDKYIDEKNITLDNIYDNVQTIEENAMYLPLEIGLIQDGAIKSFLAYGLVQSTKDYSVICKLFTIVNINVAEGKFSIEPIYGKYNSINEIIINNLEQTITANTENEFDMTYLLAEDYPKEYINIYKSLALGDPERLYNLLDEKYRNARFGNIEEFKKYLGNNREKIQRTRLDKYNVETGEESSRYICIDQYKNYYIISQESFWQNYSIMLDIYTIDIQEFIQKYDNSENKIKVALNVEKMVKAIKAQDYKYVYNKLDESFKSRNFDTIEKFEKYINEKFDASEDIISYNEYEEITGVHVYDIEITDTSKNKITKAKIVMDLKDNRDFVFSFSVEEQ